MDDFFQQKFELFRFFDSQFWLDFKDDLPEQGVTMKNTLIDHLSQNIASRKITIENVFLMYNHIELSNSFIISPNLNFLYQCFFFYQHSTLPLPFLEIIFIKNPNIILNCIEIPIFNGNQEILKTIVRISLFLMNFNPMVSSKFQEILSKISIDIILKETFIFIKSNSNNQLNFDVFSTFISKLSKSQRNFWNLFDYYIGDNRCQFTDLLKTSLKNDDDDDFDEIIEKVPTVSNLIELFTKSHQIPKFIVKLYNNDKPNFEYLIKSIQDCNKRGKEELLYQLQKQKMIGADVDFDQIIQSNPISIKEIIDYMDRSKSCCEQFSPKLLNIFHKSFVIQTTETVQSYVNQFYSKVIKLMQFQTLETFTEVAIKFLKSNLLEQHRLSLSSLILRLPITKYVPELFFDQTTDKNQLKEIQILESLHKAAIQTCNYLTLTGASSFSSPKKTKNQLTIYTDNFEDNNKPIVGFDKRILLRLRWRTIRGDALSNLSYLPEFIQLCDSDERLFIRWESQTSEPKNVAKRSQILAKLGITTNQGLISSLVFELLRSNWQIDETLLNIVIPLFSNNCDLSSLKLPENPNLDVLFRFDFLWCSAVMCHPMVFEALRKPTIEMSVSLFRSLVLSNFFTQENLTNDQVNSYFEKLFSTFPLGFSAIIANSSRFSIDSINMLYLNNDSDFFDKYQKPNQILLAEQIINQQKKPKRNMPRYFVISVVFEFAKRQQIELLSDNSNGDELWIFFCFFFAVVFGNYDIAVRLLSHYEFLFNYLRKGVNEENLFVGIGKWTDSLIQFSLYCHKNEISFDNKEWKTFTALTRTPNIHNELTKINLPINT